MTLRGSVSEFPLETILQLLAATSKTGQLEVRSAGATGALGLDKGRLVAATSGADVGEPALGAVFTIGDGDFEFVQWADAPAANLSGDLDTLLDRAVEQRDRIIKDREVIPADTARFALSERAAQHGEIKLTADEWRTLLAVNGARDVRAIAAHLGVGPLAALAMLADLARAGLLDVTEAGPEMSPSGDTSPVTGSSWRSPATTPTEPAAPVVEPSPVATAPPAPSWGAPAPAPSWEAPATSRSGESALPPQSWESRASEPLPAAPETEEAPRPDAALNDALADRIAALQGTSALPPAAQAPADDRLAALGTLGATPPPATETDPRLAAFAGVAEAEAPAALEATPLEEPAAEPQKKGGLFGGLFKREEPRATRAMAPSTAAPIAAAPSAAPTELPTTRTGKLAAFANALLAEYATGQYGTARIDDRMASVLMRVDEQADPIDRPLPIAGDRIDTSALERARIPDSQAVPYLARLISIVYDDAARAFGKDKAKRGYRAAQQQVFGSDTKGLSGPDIAGKLPKV